MKKLVLGIMAAAISFASIAQSGNEQQKGHHRKGENKEYRHKEGRAFEDMNLSESQKGQLKTINESFRNQMKSLHSDQSLSKEAMTSKRETLRNEHRSQISALLTPEQKKQWEEKRKEHRAKGKDGKKFDKKEKSRKQTK